MDTNGGSRPSKQGQVRGCLGDFLLFPWLLCHAIPMSFDTSDFHMVSCDLCPVSFLEVAKRDS